jgi:hypothetical protein
VEIPEYCREIETYLCRKNDGHLIRVVGPSFEIVSKWAADGVPLKVACRGIDRYFERYYRDGAKRRPVRVDFCEADVLDVFDEWRRAVGVARVLREGPPESDTDQSQGPQKPDRSLPTHIERALIRLTNARATGALGSDADDAIDRVAAELDRAQSSSKGLRGPARQAVIERLAALDAELVGIARRALDASASQSIREEADEDLLPFRDTMTSDAYSRAREAAIDRLTRERLQLPVLTYQ